MNWKKSFGCHPLSKKYQSSIQTIESYTLGNTFLLIGSSLATLSLILYFFLPIVALVLWLIGCGLICYGAYWNGKHKGNFHPAHHLIRMGIALVLTILFSSFVIRKLRFSKNLSFCIFYLLSHQQHENRDHHHGCKGRLCHHDGCIITISTVESGNNWRIGHHRHSGLDDKDLLHQAWKRHPVDDGGHQERGNQEAT